MPTSTTTFRLTELDRARLDRLADELVCSRTEVLRVGIATLHRNEALRSQVRAENLARAFLKSLRSRYGENAILELIDGPPDPRWRLAGAPLDPQAIDIDVRHQGDRFVMDLIDPATGVGIRNAAGWSEGEGTRHVVVPLRSLWVYAESRVNTEPRARQLFDGRTVVQIEEDDGSVRHVVLDHEGNSRALAPEELPAAAFGD